MGSSHPLPEDCLPELAQLLKSRSADGIGRESIWPPRGNCLSHQRPLCGGSTGPAQTSAGSLIAQPFERDRGFL